MTVTTSKYLLSLEDPKCRDPRRAGGKAAMLASLLQAGFDVPEGIVLTTEAFAAAGRDPILPEGVERALLQVADHFDGAPLAVRSSAEAEDLAETSFAGQYETVLGVRNPKELTQAVVRCWTSASSERVTAYRDHRHGEALGGMAVLIQRLVEAEAAGVAFTADPVSGDPSTTIVEAVAGLADRAVAGEVTPERWRTERDGEPERAGPPETVFEPSQAKEVADLARRVADHLGAPQDVEWAADTQRIWLLQARPITALAPEITPVPIAVEVPEGFWERETSHFPFPHSPLSRSLWFQTRNHVIRKTFEEFGVLLDTTEIREIGGWEYIRLVPPGGKDRPAPPAWVLGLLARIHPAMQKRVKTAREAVRSDKAGTYVQRWWEQWRPEFEAEIVRLRDVDREALSDEELDRHLEEVVGFFNRTLEAHFLLHAAVGIPLFELTVACQEVLGWEEHDTWRLLVGLSSASTEPARRLGDLSQQVRDDSGLAELLRHRESGMLERMEAEYPSFAAALDKYRREYGCRALRYDVIEPTLGEDLDTLLNLIRDQAIASIDPEQKVEEAERMRARAEEQVRSTLAARTEMDRARFERALRRAQTAYPVREDNEWYTVSAPLALIRFVALETGRRLAARGQIASADDVFFLELSELRDALRERIDRRDLVRRRKGEQAWVLAHPGPPSYGSPPGPPPSFRALPSEIRLVNEAIIWYVDRLAEAERSGATQEDDGHLEGVAASPGRYEGTVRVIIGEDEFGKLQAGDVVVCPITSPVWSVVFPNMGALVTDTGGILSHPAIIAREFRIPAVVATGNATSVLRDGQRVQVDGSKGVVELVKGSPGSQLETES